MNRIFLVLFSVFLALPGLAAPMQWKEFNFSIDQPKNWEMLKDFLGVPVTLFGPKDEREIRPIVQVIPTKGKPLNFTAAEIAHFNRKYPERRKKWIAKRKGTLLSIERAVVEKIGGQDVLVAGSNYTWNLRSFREKTYYLNCGKTLYHLKTLVDLKRPADFASADKVVETFRCAP